MITLYNLILDCNTKFKDYTYYEKGIVLGIIILDFDLYLNAL